jgi:ABC-type enterochelin transport system permease subunit
MLLEGDKESGGNEGTQMRNSPRTLAFLLEGKFTLLVVVFVLASSSIFTSLEMALLVLGRRVQCGVGIEYERKIHAFPLFLGIAAYCIQGSFC